MSLKKLGVLAALTAADAVKLLIDRADEKIILEKSGGQWRLVAPVSDVADQEIVANLLGGLSALSIGSEVSRQTEQYAAYDLLESSAARVRLFTSTQATPLFDGYFGKAALGYDSLYLRLAGEKPVYLTTGLGLYHLKPAADEFRQRALFSLKKEALRTVKIRARKSGFELKKSSAAWTSSDPRLTPEKIDSLLSGLLGLRIAAFAAGTETPAETGLDAPFLSVELAGTLKKEGFSVGKPKAEKGGKPAYRYVKVQGRDTVALLTLEALAPLAPWTAP